MRWLLFVLFIVFSVFTLFAGQGFAEDDNPQKKADALKQKVVQLYKAGRYAEAIPIAKEILAIRENTLGPDHPDTATSLNNLAELYRSMGAYAKAEPLYNRALAIWEKALGPDHPDTALSLNNLAELYKSMKEYSKAEPLYKRVLSIREKVLGPDDPDIEINLNNLAELYKSMKEYSKAEPLYKRALSIRERILGPDDPDIAISLNNLAWLYYLMRQYQKAESLYKRSLAIREKNLGQEHPDVAESLNNLAWLYYMMAEYRKSEPLYVRTLAIREKVFGPDHPDTETIMGGLALLYQSMGEYGKAEPLFKRTLAITEKMSGPDHPYTAVKLNNLAILYYSMGEYGKSEPLFRRSLNIAEKTLGPNHPHIATGLNNLAAFYQKMGEYKKSEPLLKRSLMIREKALGPDHPDTALSLNNLAGLYHSIGAYAKAEPLYNRALAIREKALGPDHPDTAASLSNLAALYYSMGAYAKAEPLYNRALAITEKALGPDHPDIAKSLNDLAALYYSMGAYAKAEPLFNRALAIWEKALGPDHPDTAKSLNNLAFFHAAQADYQEAHDLQKKAQQIDEKLIDQVIGFTSEDRALKFLSTKSGDLNGFLSLVSQHLPKNTPARKDALDVWLKRKGVILEARKQFQDALFYSDDPNAVKIFQELSAVRTRLSNLTFAGPGKMGPEKYRENLDALAAEKERLEGELSRISHEFAVKRNIAKADSDKIAKRLPADTVLIEFAKIHMADFQAKDKDKVWNPPHYLAFVLHAGDGEKIGLVDLGDAATIDETIARYKETITKRRLSYRRYAKKLHDMVFAPLIPELRGKAEIFISPDGNLNLIPFEVLKAPDERFLIEDYTFNYVAAGRDILGFGEHDAKTEAQKTPPVLMGDPAFDLNPGGGAGDTRGASDGGKTVALNRSADMRGQDFEPLPGTRKEVEAIRALIGKERAALYTGKDALESTLMQKTAPEILHLATHGFFLGDVEFELPDNTQAMMGNFSEVPVPRKLLINNPLLRSGIALAGANTSLKSESLANSEGVVTAEKILGLRLRGTDMVVLSACNTGMGDIQSGEGVYGLRRVFTQAGTKSLVMSMWSVSDEATQELMTKLYKNILEKKMDRCDALRQAALEQMAKFRGYGMDNPFYWGAFVFMGEAG